MSMGRHTTTRANHLRRSSWSVVDGTADIETSGRFWPGSPTSESPCFPTVIITVAVITPAAQWIAQKLLLSSQDGHATQRRIDGADHTPGQGGLQAQQRGVAGHATAELRRTHISARPRRGTP